MGKRSITEQQLDLYVKLLEDGYTQTQAAKEVQAGRSQLNSLVKKSRRPTRRKSIKELAEEAFKDIAPQSKTQQWWADYLGASQSQISKLFKQLGLSVKSKKTKKSTKKTSGQVSFANAKRVVDTVVTSGGSINAAIKSSGIETSESSVTAFASKIGIDLNEYKFSWKQYHNWMTVPGKWFRRGTKYSVPAMCVSCGETFMLNLCNARAGRTRSCRKCSKTRIRNLEVINTSTGEIYPSMRSWARKIGRLSQYQQLRTKLRKNNEVAIDGIAYRYFIDLDQKSKSEG